MAVKLTTSDNILIINGLYTDDVYVNVSQFTPKNINGNFYIYDNVLNKEYELGLYTNVQDDTGTTFASAQALTDYLTSRIQISTDGQTFAKSANYDASGRHRVSQTSVLGDYKQDAGILDTELFTRDGTGSSALSGTMETITCDAGEWFVLQTREFHHYFSGKSQQIEPTYINFAVTGDEIKRFGYFSSSTSSPYTADFDGFFLENNAGTITLQVWNKGTQVLNRASTDFINASAFAQIDFTKFQVSMFDFLWLGGATLRFFMVIDGVFTFIDAYYHTGQQADVMFEQPNQPFRFELRANTNTATFTYNCCQVSSEGLQDANTGRTKTIATGDSGLSLATAGTEYLILAVRQPATKRNVSMILDSYKLYSRSNNQVRYKIVINPTFPGTAPTFSGTVANFAIEYATGDGSLITASGGEMIGGDSTSTNVSGSSPTSSFTNRINHDLDGTSDIIAVTAIPGANNAVSDVFLTLRQK